MSENEKYEPIVISDEDANGLTEAIQKAVDAKLEIEHDSKARSTELAKEFADFMLDRVSEEFKRDVAPVLGLYANIPDDLKENKREKKRNAALYSFFKAMFNKSTDLILHKEDGFPKESSTSKLYALVKNIFLVMWISKNDPDVKSILKKVGLEINFTKPVDTISDGSDENEGDVKGRDGIIEEGVSALRDTVEKNLAIEDNIYPTIPENMKYDAESNPKGIKLSQFNNLAGVNMKKKVLADAGDVDKVKDLDRKTSETLFYSSLNLKMLFDTYEQIK